MKHKILVLTGGGDCPGLNAVIRALTLKSEQEGWSVFGSKNAFNGMFSEPPELIELNRFSVQNILIQGGTILGTTNKGMPSKFPITQEDGSVKLVDRTDELISKIKSNGFTEVVNIGGDGSQRISYELFKRGINIIGVPKTIDNDLAFTDFTFGYQTAVEIATDAVDKLMTTAASHQRVMILEVMGRDAGWIALNSGLAGGADIILIPEIPFDLDKIEVSLKDKLTNNKSYSIIVVAEGSKRVNGETYGQKAKAAGYQNKRLGGVGEWLAAELDDRLEEDVRCTTLGHIQRGGSPIAFDRIIATEFGVKAAELIKEQKFGVMTSYKYPYVLSVPLQDAIAKNKNVDVNSFLMKTARGIGISFGD